MTRERALGLIEAARAGDGDLSPEGLQRYMTTEECAEVKAVLATLPLWAGYYDALLELGKRRQP